MNPISARPLPPARQGMPLAEVDTPALLLDLDAFESNLDRLDASLAGHKVRIRPHAKSHKCPEIALRQMARGAIGVCCQKVSEAEAMVEGGIMNVLVSNEVVGAQKVARLATLAQRARVSVCVDNAENVAQLEAAARTAGARIDVLVEVNVGANRCGVEPGMPVVELARAIASGKHLRFAGLHAYQGAAQHARTPLERKSAIAKAVEHVRNTLDALESAGLKAEIVTGAGTGTYLLEAASGVYNEIQPGSYVFMDADYNRNLGDDGRPLQGFAQSLYVWTTVMSRPAPERAVVDAGLKALSVDSGMPQVADLPGVEFLKASDEHGVLSVSTQVKLALGDKIRLIPGHCDPTVNLYDWIVGIRGGKVECVWPITARGAFY
ncbi:MAG TPA: DSD1 family PLP-dependent enzyme [Burkholderiales bacterium]|nr:DSD1 family PLP-dependent enzyme [Burkholderiales bacterium]